MFFRSTIDKGKEANKGAQAEARAELFLQTRGLKSCAKNYRSPQGEIDLIMRDGEILVFIEVRLRNNPRFEQAAESVNGRKQQKIIRTAQHYLLQHKLTDRLPCRFDVVAINGAHDTDIEWISDAFSAI